MMDIQTTRPVPGNGSAFRFRNCGLITSRVPRTQSPKTSPVLCGVWCRIGALAWSLALLWPLALSSAVAQVPAARDDLELPVEVVQDKIRGGLLGHLLGDLNGLPHEMKYIAEPGNVREYVPSLPNGAWTDDDTDFEWVYVVAMQQRGVIRLLPAEIRRLWQTHINRLLWCANQYARQLMDLGLEPPVTGLIHFNPWSDFNISGQFVCESWGLMAPGMPQTAARIGLNHTRATICGEPAQTTQLFDAMIAVAFLTHDLNRILDAGVAAVDRASVLRQVIADVRAWHQEHPADWRATRRLVKEKYSRHQGGMRDRNGFELNTASVVGALLYGRGDYVQTAIAAFNFGWDADNNAATAGTILGVIHGARWMQAQGWEIKDVYRNTSRDQMPADETITRFGDRLIALAERVIVEQGGARITRNGRSYYRIQVEPPASVMPLSDPTKEFAGLRAAMKADVEAGIVHGTTAQERARAAYQAICLDLARSLREQHPDRWTEALEALRGYPRVLGVLFFESPTPAGDRLRQRALEAGLTKPEKRVKIW